MNGKSGFTLVELMVVMALMAAITALTLVAIRGSAETVALADAATVVQSNVRDTVMELTRELQLASKRTDAAAAPPLDPLRVVDNPVPGSPVEVVFQLPADTSGSSWTTPIRFRYVNEDADGDGVLGAEEDLDGDGVLTRTFFRLQDRNGDGDTNDPGESRRLGSANDISACQFALNAQGDVLDIAVTASRAVAANDKEPLSETVTTRVYLAN